MNFWKNKYGLFRDVWILLFAIILVLGLAVGLVCGYTYFQVRSFNGLYNTNYTFSQWFWNDQAIKLHHLELEKGRK